MMSRTNPGSRSAYGTSGSTLNCGISARSREKEAICATLLVVAAATGRSAEPRIFQQGFDGAQRITVQSTDQRPIDLWIFRSPISDASSAAAVVLMHGCAGLFGPGQYSEHSSSINRLYQEWAHTLNQAGAHVIAVDSFSGRSADRRQNFCGDRSAVESISAREEWERAADASVAAVYAVARLGVDADRIGLIGWSHGGSAALAATHGATPFRATAAFYPGCGLYGRFGNPGSGASNFNAGAETKIFTGALDAVSLATVCVVHATSSQQSGGAPVEVRVFPEALHSFDSAICRPDAIAGIQSPWTGQRYSCQGSYAGMPFSLYDYRAKREADHAALCLFEDRLSLGGSSCGQGVPPLP